MTAQWQNPGVRDLQGNSELVMAIRFEKLVKEDIVMPCIQQVLINGWMGDRRSQAKRLLEALRVSCLPKGLPCPISAGPVHGKLQWRCVTSPPQGPLLSALIHTEKECSTLRLHIMSTWKGRTWSLHLYLRTVLFSASMANDGYGWLRGSLSLRGQEGRYD